MGIKPFAALAQTVQGGQISLGTGYDNIGIRTLTIGNAAKSVNGAGNVSWSLAEIGAAPGGFGLGGYCASLAGDLNTVLRTQSGFYNADAASVTNGFQPSGWCYYMNMAHGNSAGYNGVLAMSFNGAHLGFKTVEFGADRGWKTIYHTGNKPTSADVGLGSVNNWEASSAVNLASDTTYATAGAVKKAYDLAAAAMPKTGGIFSAGIAANGSISSDSGVIRSKAAGNTSGGIHIGGGNGYAEIAPMLNADNTPVWAQSLRYHGPDDWRIGVTSRIFHQNYLPTAAQVGARPNNWMPTAADVGAVGKAGDTMTGSLTTPKVLVSGTQGAEANALTRRDYVGTELAKKLNLTGGTMTGNLTAPTVLVSSAQNTSVNALTRKDYVDSAIATAIGGVTPESIGARPDNWLPSLSEIGAAASADLDPLIPAASASFVYTGSTLTQMTEQLPAGERVTAYSYTDGRLTSAVETLGQLVRTTTYTYQAGSLTGFTTTEGGA